MKESKKIYWKSLAQLKNDTAYVKEAQNEFAPAPGPEEDLGHSRRDFLKMMGFGISAATLAACEAPIRKAIPYVNKPANVSPGVPNYYASSYINGTEYCSIVVKTREGRPIKIDGNDLSGVTGGAVNAQVEASVLSLYDNSRLRNPKAGAEKKESMEWGALDSEVIAKLEAIAAKGGQIRIVSHTILSPSTKAAIDIFKAKYPTTQHIVYDQNSAYGIRKANEESFGTAMIPSYDFSKAEVVVSVGADFLNSWVAPIEFNKQYAKTRQVSETKPTMSRHYQFESILSITGANADYRTPVKPSEEGAVVVQLYNLIASKAGAASVSGGIDKQYLQKAADDLWASRGKSLVVAGSNDKSVQVIVNAINSLLGNYGNTILPGVPLYYHQGDDSAMAGFANDIEAGRIDGVIFYNCNPVYDHPMGAKIAAGIKKASLSISTVYKEDETGVATYYLAPDHHYLESWNDFEPKKNHFSLSQPVITPIFNTRHAQESLMVWAGQKGVDYFEFVRNNWKSNLFKGQGVDFQTFWDSSLYNGIYELPVTETVALNFAGNVAAAAGEIAKSKSQGFELVIYENGTVGNGSQANNPLLQEIPEPITKASWEHYVTVSPKDAADISFDESKTKIAAITINGQTIKLPILKQPGQLPGVIGIPLGYGRTNAGKVANGLGVNIYPFIPVTDGSLSYKVNNVTFEITDEDYQIAQTQTQDTYMGRQTVIQEALLDEFQKNPKAGSFDPKVATWRDTDGEEDHKMQPDAISLWRPHRDEQNNNWSHQYLNHHWGMAIDLNTCTGCAACVVSCTVENNVALVGREEIIRRREMLWLRIDRYYSSDASSDDWKGAEKAAENPEVVFQPMLCQHCNNAPCETVCPVAATTHSSEGLNQMTYNRCIGTRYCANNCPYKVRRFNWFKYHDNAKFEQVNPAMNTSLGKMVLNPDVTVRSRGVMEKCTFCVQRIQAGKLEAKKEGRPVKDGEVVTACQAACSTGAIVFGDLNDADSKISKLLKIKPQNPEFPYRVEKESENPRAYQVLMEIGTRPNIWYLRKIRNREESQA